MSDRRGRAAALLLAAALVAAPGLALDAIDLFNPLLSPDYASWLVGPYGRMASKEEIREFGALTDDEDARQFIESFWARRDPDSNRPGNPVRDLAEERAVEADRRFTESGYPGRRTDRGAIFVLYGEPEKLEHEPGDFVGDPPLEVWRYPSGTERGLDGEKPDRRYRFVQKGDLTVLYVAGLRRQRPITRPVP